MRPKTKNKKNRTEEIPMYEPDLVTVSWNCQCAIGPPEWIGTESLESPECDTQGEITLDRNEMETSNGKITYSPSVYCTSCHQELDNSDLEFVTNEI